jgi:hypothetical protein
VRKTLSLLLTLTGVALGLAASAGVVALIWPDLDIYAANAIRTVPRTFILAILVGVGASWPFLWLADRISPQAPSPDGGSSSGATSIASDKKRHRRSAVSSAVSQD